jgi:hypothetical protein
MSRKTPQTELWMSGDYSVNARHRADPRGRRGHIDVWRALGDGSAPLGSRAGDLAGAPPSWRSAHSIVQLHTPMR